MLAYDANIFYSALRDCRTTFDKLKCEGRKKLALKALKLGEVIGCVIPPTVREEVKKSWLEELAPHCRTYGINDTRKQRFIDRFIDKLVVRAMHDPEFLAVCTSEAPTEEARIAKAKKGDWKIVAETFLLDEPIRLVTFDHNIFNNYCKKVYREVAEEIAQKLGLKIQKDWDAIKPELVLTTLEKVKS